MQKNAPTLGRTLVMVFFALSCVGILLYLWLTFGGAIPLQAKSYQLNVRFPEATTLADEADVRISGVKVGKVSQLDRDGDVSRAKLQIDARFSPIKNDSHAVLRQKSLLGETYVELTPGTKGAGKLRDGATLPDGSVAATVELDEIFQTFDPKTREAFRIWMDQQGRAVDGRGADLNDALGNLTPFINDAGVVVKILNEQSADTRRLVRDTGEVFQALTERDGQLTQLITNSNRVFETTAARNRELQEIFTIFPTFLNEARATTSRVTRFSINANPLITQLRPAARELSPTLIQLRALAPDLKGLFRDIGPLITASRRGLPALEGVLQDTRPLLKQLSPFLRDVNPILDWLGLYRREIASFFTLDAAATQATDLPPGATETIHYLRTANPLNAENLAVHPRRLATNRSNPYVEPGGYKNFPLKVFGTYLCTNNPTPPLAPIGIIPPPILAQLPPGLLDLVDEFALSPPDTAPPCVEQGPLGRFTKPPQTGKYPQIKRYP